MAQSFPNMFNIRWSKLNSDMRESRQYAFLQKMLGHQFCVFPLALLASVNGSVVLTSVITPSWEQLMAKCCAGLHSQLRRAKLHCVSLNGIHCHPLQHTPSILYFPVRDLRPSVIPLSSVPHSEGFCWEGPWTKLPLWQWLTGKLLNEMKERTADTEAGYRPERAATQTATQEITIWKVGIKLQRLWRCKTQLSLCYNKR